MTASKTCLHRVVPDGKIRRIRPSCNARTLTTDQALTGIIHHDPKTYIVSRPAQVSEVVKRNRAHIEPVSPNRTQLCQKGVGPAPLSRLEYTRSRSREVGRSSRTRDICVQCGVHRNPVTDIITGPTQVSGIQKLSARDCGRIERG